MTVLIIGSYPEHTAEKIRAEFPEEWTVRILPPDEADAFLPEAEAVIPEHVRVDEAFLARAEKLRFVQTGAGYDNVDVEACSRRGIQVCNAGGINAAAVAEHTLALMLCWHKNIHRLELTRKSGGWETEYTGGELAGKTVGVIGLGKIGQQVAVRCAAFGMRVLGYSRRPVSLAAVEQTDLNRLLGESDIVTLHVPLTPVTEKLIAAEELSRMKRSALLVNTARGGVVDEAELAEALRRGEIGGACLDVYEQEPLPPDSPLRQLSNVILTPHMAGYPDGVKYHRKRYGFFRENIGRVMRGELPESRVNELLQNCRAETADMCAEAERIRRISAMEERLNAGRRAADALAAALEDFRSRERDMKTLMDYYGSPDWFADLESCDRGELPPDLRCGVLSEDAVYDLLTDCRELQRELTGAERAIAALFPGK